MKLLIAVALLVLSGCDVSTTDRDNPADTTRKKTTAEEAFDAGQKARKKAEAIKEEQDRKARETDDAANQ